MRIADIFGLAAMFLIIAFVGWRSSKKVKNMDDFTLAGSGLGKIQAGFSMAATEFGGSSLIGAMALCYSIGVAGAWWDWSAVPALIILGLFFAEKIKLPNLVTITDFFEKRYNYPTKLMASLMHILAIATQISAQFTVGAVALNGIFGVPKTVGILISVVFALIYTMSGGLLSVVNTDVVQFIMIIGSIIIALPISLHHAGGFEGLAASLDQSFLSFGNIDYKTVISWCLFCFFTYATSQHYIQRVFASRDKSTAKFAFVFTGVIYIIYGLIISLIGVCIVVLIPNLSDPNTGYTILIKNFMPSGIAGLILGGIFAASMSTADSMILAASTLFVNDIYTPLIAKNKENKENKNGLMTIRIVTLIVCVVSVIISMFMDNIVDIMYLGGLFYSTSVFFPLIIGLKWKRATAPAAIISIIASVTIGLLAELVFAGSSSGIFSIPSNVLSALTSLIVFLAVSLITKKPDNEKLEFLNQ